MNWFTKLFAPKKGNFRSGDNIAHSNRPDSGKAARRYTRQSSLANRVAQEGR